MDAEEGEEVKPESVDVSEEIQPECDKCRRKTFKFRTREEIKLHRASILRTLKEQNSSFKVIFGSKSPQHSNINFKFQRKKLFCFIQKSYVQVFTMSTWSLFKE